MASLLALAQRLDAIGFVPERLDEILDLAQQIREGIGEKRYPEFDQHFGVLWDYHPFVRNPTEVGMRKMGLLAELDGAAAAAGLACGR